MSDRLARSAGLIGLATMTSRVLGLVRDAVQAMYFGTTAAADAFALATRIPTLLRDLFAEGAMSAAFVPTFTRYLTKEGKPAAFRLGSQVINGLLVVTSVLVVLGIVFAEPIATFAAPEFQKVGGKLELAISLTRVNMPFLILIAVAAAYMGMLNALGKFFVPACSPILYNVVFIGCTVAFVPVFTRMGIEPVMALSVGMLLGGLAQVMVQWPLMRQQGYRHQWILTPRDSGLHEVLILMGPGSIGVAAAQINLLVSTILATQHAGAASALGFAFRLMYLPIGIFGVSVATAAIPDLARHAQHGSMENMRTTLSWGMRLMLVLSVPATVGLMVLAGPIVELALQRGTFNAGSTALVAGALLLYAPGIVGYSLVKIISPSFYALRDARTPVIAGVVTIVANLVLNIWLNGVMQERGLALGTGIAANVNAGLLLFLLSRRIGGIDGKRVLATLVKISIASAVMGVAAYYSEAWIHAHVPARLLGFAWLPNAIRVFGAIAVALTVLTAAASALGVEEFNVALRRVLRRKTPSTPEVG